MGRYDRFDRPPLPTWEERLQMRHPFWGPLGCGFLVLVMLMGYALAVLFLQWNAEHHWMVFPPALLRQKGDPFLWVKGLLAIAFGLTLYALLGLVYAVLARLAHETPRTPLDVPPPPRPRRSLRGLIQSLVVVLALALGVGTVVWLRGKPWEVFPASLVVPGPLPDLFFYILAATVWWFFLQLLMAIAGALLKPSASSRRQDL